MANAAYWFKHDSNAKDDHKIMLLMDQLGLEGYGIYWVLIEVLREQDGYKYPMAMLPLLAKRYATSAEKMKAVVIGYGLFEVFDDQSFVSPSLLRRMGEYSELVERRRIAGRKGGEARVRQLSSKCQAKGKQMPSKSLANREDQSGLEKIGLEGKRGKMNGECYRAFAHLSINSEEIEKLKTSGYSTAQIDDVLDRIENYRQNTKYKSLYMTALKWLKSDASKPDKEESTFQSFEEEYEIV